MCRKVGEKPSVERDADLFASNLLMPSQGILGEIPADELRKGISVSTILRLEQLFSVSHEAMVYRLRSLSIISESDIERLLGLSMGTTFLSTRKEMKTLHLEISAAMPASYMRWKKSLRVIILNS